jgi:hypothetical protein
MHIPQKRRWYAILNNSFNQINKGCQVKGKRLP